MPRVPGASTTAVIVTYNSSACIADALDEAARSHDAGLLDAVVVDNASKDGTVDLVRSRFPWVRVVEPRDNLGFGRGCNAGLDVVQTPYVLFLNPDAVLPVAALRTLIAFMDSHPRAIFAAPATENYGGAEYQGAGGLPTPGNILHAAWSQRLPSSRRTIRPGEPPFTTDWLGGGIMLGRCEFVRALKGFDPRFFLYFEETDLCRRALAAGYELWAVGEATARHAGGTAAKATGRTLYRASIAEHYFRSRFYYLIKHFGFPAAFATEVLELVLLAARSTAKRLLGRAGGDLRERLSGPILRLPARQPPASKTG